MRAVIITGAGSGIGRATAIRLAKDHFAIALIGRTRATLDKVTEEIRSLGGKAIAIVADVSQSAQVETMVKQTVDALGRIDVLVNNAGVAPAVPLAKLSPEQWRTILETNLSSVFYATRAVWPVMERQFRAAVVTHNADSADSKASGNFPTGGVIINISSMASKDPFPGLGAYAAAKIGVNMLTLVTAREGHEVGIRAVCIAPAAVDTPMFRNLIGNQPLDRDQVLAPEDVAAMVTDAISGSLRFTSGDTLFIHKRPA